VSSLRSVGLLAACDDRALLGFKLWPRQRKLLADVERGPRLHVWALGRRSGKSTMAALALLWDALLRPELDSRVRPGQRRYSVAVATNLRQAQIITRAALSVVERSPLLAELVESATETEIVFANGATIASFPCTSRGGRGWPISCLVLDELAHHVDSEGNSAAESVWRALVPSTAQFGSAARVIASSTPFGSAGLFADMFERARNGELEDAVARHGASAEVNPTLDVEFLERERARDPESFKSEYLAQFVGSGGAFLDPERIDEAVAKRGELLPDFGILGYEPGWVAGIDPAFASDPFGLAIVGRPPEQPGRLVLGLARAWRPSGRRARSFDERREFEDAVLAEVAEVCWRYRARVVTDQFAAQPIADYLRRRGLSVEAVPMSATTKTEAFAALRARLNEGSLELYEEPTLLAELRRLRTKYRAGHAAVVNPRVGGSHGDLAQALALSVWRYGPLTVASPNTRPDRRGVLSPGLRRGMSL
jgi:phage terminase large subunit-like protein